jgi:hypothetical protein
VLSHDQKCLNYWLMCLVLQSIVSQAKSNSFFGCTWWDEVIVLNKTTIHLDNMLYCILLYNMSYTHTRCVLQCYLPPITTPSLGLHRNSCSWKIALPTVFMQITRDMFVLKPSRAVQSKALDMYLVWISQTAAYPDWGFL